MPGDETNISELIASVRKSLPKVLLFGALTSAAILGYTYINKPKWIVSSSLLVVMQDDMPQAASLGSILGKESASPYGVLTGVLNSRRSFEFISQKTGIKVKELRERLLVKDSPSASQLKIEFPTTDIEQGKKVINSAIEILEKLDKEASFSTSLAQLKKLEELYGVQLVAVDGLSKKVMEFQKTAKVVTGSTLKTDGSGKADSSMSVFAQLRDVDFQLASVNKQISDLKAKTTQSVESSSGSISEVPGLQKWRERVRELQFDLKVARTQFGDEYPEVVALTRQLKLAETELQSEISKQLKAVSAELDPSIAQLAAKRNLLVFQQGFLKDLVDRAPEEIKSLRELERDLATSEANLQQLRVQLQQARIKAAARLLQWRILDDPAPSEEPTNKDFKTRGVISFVVACLFGMFVVAMRFLSRVRPSHETSI